MVKTFKEVENEFSELKRKFRRKMISEREFKDRLKKLRLNDRSGRCWTIGARTGKWYYFDDDKWIESRPPSFQDGKAVCIYCGFENDLEAEVCEYCGGHINENLFKCPECGFILEDPHSVCPVCQGQIGAEETGEETDYTPPQPKISKASWENLKEWNADTAATEASDEKNYSMDDSTEKIPLEHLGEANYSIRSVDFFSVTLFFGMTGLILGLISGVFIGTTSLLQGLIEWLPDFYQSLHGKITGGIIFGITGGILGFTVLASIGFFYALFINIVLTLLGGLKFRMDKID
jgi:rubrerythrin